MFRRRGLILIAVLLILYVGSDLILSRQGFEVRSSAARTGHRDPSHHGEDGQTSTRVCVEAGGTILLSERNDHRFCHRP